MLENTINISNCKERVRDIMILFCKCKDDAAAIQTENRALKEEVAALTQKLMEMNAAKETAEFAALAAARPRQSAR
jgi:predicted  nucleic acid-binding Zn-ribbon protein